MNRSPSCPDYNDWANWTEEDFAKYQMWCISNEHFICRNCWHLHCRRDECTMSIRVRECYETLSAMNVFPNEVCELIASKIPTEDLIN